MQQLQQLTHLHLERIKLQDAAGDNQSINQCYTCSYEGDTLAPAFSAMTASSKLEYLGFDSCTLPVGALEHLFPTGRHLPHLLVLDLACVVEDQFGGPLVAPDGSSLTSCCPALQSLYMEGSWCGQQHLAPLTALTALDTLSVSVHYEVRQEVMQCVCQLTRLRQLEAFDDSGTTWEDGSMLQVTQLQQLTHLGARIPSLRSGGFPCLRTFSQRVSTHTPDTQCHSYGFVLLTQPCGTACSLSLLEVQLHLRTMPYTGDGSMRAYLLFPLSNSSTVGWLCLYCACSARGRHHCCSVLGGTRAGT